jgi:hypothetical protein
MSSTRDERGARQRASARRAERRRAADALPPSPRLGEEPIRWLILDGAVLVAEIPDHPFNDPRAIARRLAREAGRALDFEVVAADAVTL